MSFSDHLLDLPLHKRNIRFSGVNCALGPSKSIRYSGDFVIAGFILTYFTVILPGFSNGVFVIAGCQLSNSVTMPLSGPANYLSGCHKRNGDR